jgi:hypothetical protein
MTTLYLSGLAFAVIALLVWALRRDATARGKTEAHAETYEHVIENVKKANAVRDRLKSDPAYTDKLRDKYRRD